MSECNRNRGSIYVLVLGVALIVTTIGLGALAVVRAQGRINDANGDAAEARFYALSAIEMGRMMIAQDSNWRNTYLSGGWPTNMPVGAGTLTLQVVNPNGALNHASTDPVILTGIGAKGAAIQRIAVTL